ncbi:MAG: UDP-N-acetylmuramate--L-alanine ligase [Candidatus Omnitrophica bacterium]|nr:UDP-N-acetylmuramate--L-alanine ligase [Candidatus Omnitrophota bacterium]
MSSELLSKIKRVHLLGIGGVGMTGLAFLLKERGFIVSGSDIKESYNTNLLKEYSFKVFMSHSISNLEDVDLVCFSSAIKDDNIELLEAKRRRLPVMRRAELLAILSQDDKVIAISGSHGKTTTSAMAAFVLNELGYNPNVFIGGVSLNFGKCAWAGKDIFVVETDESDGSFLLFKPWISIITNIDVEHLDFYRDKDNLEKSFLEFSLNTKGTTIGCGDEANVRYILDRVRGVSYGFSPHNDVRAENIRRVADYTVFDLIFEKDKFFDVKISLLGEHNVLNSLAIICLAQYLGESIDKVINILGRFRGTKRRFEIKDNFDGVIFVDDYAHHPTEIEAVLRATDSLSKKRIVVIFQPHRYSRVKLLYEEFSRCFYKCDYLIVTDIYSAGEDKINGIDGEFIFNEIKKNFNKDIVYIHKENLYKEVPLILEEGDLVLGLGAGDINIIMDSIVNEFKAIRIKKRYLFK